MKNIVQTPQADVPQLPVNPVRCAVQQIGLGAPFDLDGASYQIEQRLPAASGALGDVLLVRATGLSGQFRRLALRMRELELLVEHGRVRLRSGSTADAITRPGWRRRARSLFHRLSRRAAPDRNNNRQSR